MKKRGFVNSILSKMQKRGLSTVVITLIIILISLVAVGIVWVVVRNVINTGTKEVTFGQFTLDAKIKNVLVDGNSNNVSLAVRRSPGQGEFSKMNFVFYDGKSSEVITQPVSLNELEEKWFMFHLSTINVSNLVSISIVPFLKQDEKEVLGNVLDKYTVSEQTSTIPICVPATCASLGYECGLNWANGNCSGTFNCEPPNCASRYGAGYTCNSSGRCVLTNSLCQNLILLMHFDNNSAVGENNTFVYDWSGNGNKGRVVNNPRMNLTGGKYGGSFYFENKSDYIYLSGLSSKVNISGTISFWLYYMQYETNDGFVVFDNPLATMVIDSYTRLSFIKLTGPSYASSVQSNAPIPLNRWNLYTLTWNQTSARIYRNGTLDAQTLAITLPYNNLVDGYIGSDRIYRSMNGSIDDVAIWNRTLTDTEILNIYNSGTAINC